MRWENAEEFLVFVLAPPECVCQDLIPDLSLAKTRLVDHCRKCLSKDAGSCKVSGRFHNIGTYI